MAAPAEILRLARRFFGPDSGVALEGNALQFSGGPPSLGGDLGSFLNAVFTDEGVAGELLALVPEDLPSANGAAINLTDFTYHPDVGLTVGLAWDPAEPWDPVPDLISVDRVEVQLFLADESAGGGSRATISGKLDLSGVAIEVQVSAPGYSIGFSAAPPDEGWTVDDLLDFFEFDVAGLEEFPSGDAGFSTLGVERFTMLGDARAGILTFELALANSIKPKADQKFDLNNLSLRVVYLSGEVIGSVEASADFDGTAVGVGAGYGGAGQGWQFSGRATVGRATVGRATVGRVTADPGIPVGDWLDQFAAFLPGDLSLPDEMAGLTVSRFEVAFSLDNNGGVQDLVLACEGQMPTDGGVLEADLTVNPNAEEQFFGRIALAELAFRISFGQASGDGTLLLGTYDASEADERVSLDLVDFANQAIPGIALDLGEVDVAISPDRALVVSQSGAGVLIALDMGNLDDLSELPVVGEHFNKYGVTFGYRLLVASKVLTTVQVRAINEKLNGSFEALPEGPTEDAVALRKGLNLLATVTLGHEPLQLTSGGNGGAPADDQDSPPAVDDGAPPAGDGEQSSSLENSVTWLPVQRSVGPLYFSQIGFEYKDGTVGFHLDASITIAALTFSLQGLALRTPLSAFRPELALSGLGLNYSNGPIEIAGLFLREGDEFTGAALIKAKTFSISAFGAYRQIDGNPAMFLYAVLDKALGGPSFFYVTGLALGFGFNRAVRLPPVAGVEIFPLVQAATDPAAFDKPDTLLSARTEEGLPYFPVKIGDYWIAAGVRFNSFQLLDSFALLLVKFGQELDIVLMGISTLKLPKAPPGKEAPAYLYAELQFKISVKPAAGEVKAEAQLTENSYVIDPNARLTGGFAFYAWFGGKYQGDFVLTLGGYHPNFQAPSHYPQVPRLAISWPVNDELSIKGTAYFALTPSSVMAGGALEATYDDGVVRATFTARANFLMRWEPFFYDIDLSISLLVSATLDVLLGEISLSTSLGADLHIWGPEFAGTAHIEWSVISFDIAFGDSEQPAHSFLSWDEFATTFLPAPDEETKIRPISRINISAGLVSETGDGAWIVLADEVRFDSETYIPATEIELGLEEGIWASHATDPEVGFRSMGSGPVISKHQIMVQNQESGDWLDLSAWQLEVRRQAVAKELWHPVNDEQPPTPSADLLPDRLVGVSGLRPRPKGLSAGRSPDFELDTFAFDDLDPIHLPIRPGSPVSEIAPDQGFDIAEDQTAAALITSTALATKDERLVILAAANVAGFRLEASGVLSELVENVETSFQSPPMMGVLGSSGRREQTIGGAIPIEVRPVEEPSAETIVNLLARIFQNRYVSARQVSDTAMGATAIPADGAREKLTGEVDKTASHDLVAGQSLAWELDAKELDEVIEPALSIENNNGQRVRVLALDRYGRLLKDAVVSGNDELPLSVEAARVLVTGLPGQEEPTRPTAGWHGSSALIQMRPRVFAGDGVVVRAQASRRRRQAGDSGLELVSGEGLVGQNLEPDQQDRLNSGWIRTYLPADGGFRCLAVSVKRSDLGAPTRPNTVVTVRLAGGESILLQPRHLIRESESEIVLLYALPGGLRLEAPANSHTAVLTQAGAGWQIHGVLGIRERVALVRSRWPEYRLRPEVTNRPDGPEKAPLSVSVVKAAAA